MGKDILIFLCIMLISSMVFSLAISDVPQPMNFLNDYSGTLSTDNISELNQLLKSVSEDSNIEIGVWLIDSTEGKPINEYALELGNKFLVGNKYRYDGIVILVAIKDREYFIATAKGAETLITDIQIRNLQIKDFDPNFKKGDFFTGLKLIIIDISNDANDDGFLVQKVVSSNEDDVFMFMFFIIIIGVVVVGFILIVFSESDSDSGSIGGSYTPPRSSYRSSGSSYRRPPSSGGSSSWGGGSSSGGFGGFGNSGGFSGGGAGGRF